ncbi:hypothetical protein CC80DRAFT_592882 [Byssothecium circinans]|uniref:Uncharacterized protein n=1 Tax=Byssothecium circinans TaxID=147558 RepID=A0A6A5U129_9PLEO|nr:hypothetical protein CC80DRAFT_592882 [Byssothecium circinans]
MALAVFDSRPNALTHLNMSAANSDSATSSLEILTNALGDKANFLEQLPFEKLEYQRHQDDVSLTCVRISTPVSLKVAVASVNDEILGGEWTVWGYLFHNTQTEPIPKVAYFALDNHGKFVKYSSQDLIDRAFLKPVFPPGCTRDQVPILLKYYFYKLGVHLPTPITVSNAFKNELIRACEKFAETLPNRPRATRRFVSQNPSINKPNRSFEELFDPAEQSASAHVAQGGSASPAANVQEFFIDTIKEAIEQESKHATSLRNIRDSKAKEEKVIEEENAELLELEKRVSVLRKSIGDRQARVAKMAVDEGLESTRLAEAKNTRKRILEESNPSVKSILELGMRMGREESNSKRRKSG